MPRRSSGPRLYWDRNRESWTIIDGRFHRRTGFGAADIKQAERTLRDYITGKHKPAEGPNPILADVLATYAEEHVKHLVSGKSILYDIGHLNKWWGTKKVTDISAASCRQYVASRDAGASARRELAFLNAAIRHWKANHAPLMATPKITMPAKPQPRQDFMTRGEAARFLWIARRTPHLARFFLLGDFAGGQESMNISLGRCQRLGHCGFIDCICDAEPTMKNNRTPFDPKEFADFRRAIRSGEFAGIPMEVGAALTQKQALVLAIQHIEHMAAWITKQKAGYSFESLGEDMPGIKGALSLSPTHETPLSKTALRSPTNIGRVRLLRKSGH